MTDLVELTEGQKEARRMLDFESKLRAAEIRADEGKESLDELVRLAEEAVSITTIGQPLFTYFYDENRSCEYFSTKDQFYCKYYKNEDEREKQLGKDMRLQPETFVKWNLDKFSAHDLIKTLYTVVFGKDDMPSYLHYSARSVLGLTGKHLEYDTRPEIVKEYLGSRPRTNKDRLGNDVTPIETETFF